MLQTCFITNCHLVAFVIHNQEFPPSLRLDGTQNIKLKEHSWKAELFGLDCIYSAITKF